MDLSLTLPKTGPERMLKFKSTDRSSWDWTSGTQSHHMFHTLLKYELRRFVSLNSFSSDLMLWAISVINL